MIIKSIKNNNFPGQYLGDFISHLYSRCSTPLGNLQCVGHSLGSHVCSYAAKAFTQKTGSKIGRLVGLDPAGPCFDDPQIRGLNKTDATWVNAIHTDAGVLGTSLPRGTLDSYPNGGSAIQPGCPLITMSPVDNLHDLLDSLSKSS